MPISGDSGLYDLRDRVATILAEAGTASSAHIALLRNASFRADYVKYNSAGQFAPVHGRPPKKICRCW